MAPRLLLLLVGTLLPSAVNSAELHGSGTTNPSKLIWKSAAFLEEASAESTRITYRGIGSGGGQAEFTVDDNDFGSGDIPLGQTDYDAVTATSEMLHIPFLVGGVSFFHSVPGVERLVLSACVLADIYQAKITTWDHASIKALNPGFSPPAGQPIYAARRALGSSSTSAVTAYLAASVGDCGSTWDIGTGKGGPGKTPTWPASLVEAQGSDGMAGQLDITPYSIAYVDSGHGVALGLHEVAVSIAGGGYKTSAEADIATAASAVTLPLSGESWANVDLIYKPGAWPMCAFSYFYVRKDQTANTETGALLKAFLQFMMSDKVQNDYLAEFGFYKMTPEAIAQSQAAADSIVLATGVTPWTFEIDTEYNTGAGPHVFSYKRRTYEEYQLGVLAGNLEDGNVALNALKAEVQELKDMVAALKAKVEEEATGVATGGSSAGGSSAPAASGTFHVNFYNNEKASCTN